jgi:hypothetical protein
VTDPVSQRLEKFQEKDITVRTCRMLFEAIPMGPPFVFYRDLKGAADRLGPFETEASLTILEAARSDDVERSLWIADKLDVADAALASYVGASNLISWLTGGKPGRRKFEADRQQAIDAALKVIGTAYMTNRLFAGGVRERLAGFLSLPAGRELLSYLCVVEVALPFFDNIAEQGWSAASKHIQVAMADGESKFRQITGEGSVGDLTGMVREMHGLLEQTMTALHDHLNAIAGKLKRTMPTVLTATDSITGAIATASDALPAWRFMGARLAAEACAQRAISAGQTSGLSTT